MRVYICNIPDVTISQSVAHIPYIYGALRSHAEQIEEIRNHVHFMPPLWRHQSHQDMLEHFQDPQLIGFSTYIWNEKNSHRLAKAVKAKFPNSVIVFGGPQIPNNPSSYLQEHPWVDILVHGEGETPFSTLLQEQLKDAPDWSAVPGISYLKDGEQVFGPSGVRLSKLDFPSPYLEGYFAPLLSEAREENPYITMMACMETNRGCPYSCSFCDWGMATMSKLRRYEMERVKAEFEWASDNEVQGIILNDANFGILPRDVELAEHVAALKSETGFPRNFYPLGLAKNNKDRAFAINKIIIDNKFDPFEMNVNFSLQATSQTTLDAINRQNIPLENYRSLADRYSKEGYQLTPDLILPLPGETLESFQEGYADLASWKHVSRIRIYPCGILPNAPMACPEYRQKWGLETRRIPLGPQPGLGSQKGELEVEMIETVVATNTMSEAEHAQAKVFVALVNALELYGLTSAVRHFACEQAELTPGEFYRQFWQYQLQIDGTLATGLSLESSVFELTYCDELIGSVKARTYDGKFMKHHKVLAYDALTRPEQFLSELQGFLSQLGVSAPEELFQYQKELWITPEFDPQEEQEFHYQWNWPNYFSGTEPLTERATKVHYPVRSGWLEYGYKKGVDTWLSFALAVNSVDTHCVQLAALEHEKVVPATP